jgi:hypothetical protein
MNWCAPKQTVRTPRQSRVKCSVERNNAETEGGRIKDENCHVNIPLMKDELGVLLL